MTDPLWSELADAVLDLERELRGLGLWAQHPPAAELLASQQPFCVDTLGFEQWLQWIFVPRMTAIIQHGRSLPGAFSIAPMGEETLAWMGRRRYTLVAILTRIDGLAAKLS